MLVGKKGTRPIIFLFLFVQLILFFYDTKNCLNVSKTKTVANTRIKFDEKTFSSERWRKKQKKPDRHRCIYVSASLRWPTRTSASRTWRVTRPANGTCRSREDPIPSGSSTWWPRETRWRGPWSGSTTRPLSSALRNMTGGRSGPKTSTSPGSWPSCRW